MFAGGARIYKHLLSFSFNHFGRRIKALFFNDVRQSSFLCEEIICMLENVCSPSLMLLKCFNGALSIVCVS